MAQTLPPPSGFGPLVPDTAYLVVRGFTDFDGDQHAAGEAWTFLTHAFLPYDDGLSLFVRGADGEVRHIRMQLREDTQGPVIDKLADYVQAVG